MYWSCQEKVDTKKRLYEPLFSSKLDRGFIFKFIWRSKMIIIINNMVYIFINWVEIILVIIHFHFSFQPTILRFNNWIIGWCSCSTHRPYYVIIRIDIIEGCWGIYWTLIGVENRLEVFISSFYFVV